jgi:hypothetical protein
MIEFTCCECGTNVVDVSTDTPRVPPLCMRCLHIPGWHEDPKLRKIFGAHLEPGRLPDDVQ